MYLVSDIHWKTSITATMSALKLRTAVFHVIHYRIILHSVRLTKMCKNISLKHTFSMDSQSV